jgi:hypothetical protein
MLARPTVIGVPDPPFQIEIHPSFEMSPKIKSKIRKLLKKPSNEMATHKLSLRLISFMLQNSPSVKSENQTTLWDVLTARTKEELRLMITKHYGK